MKGPASCRCRLLCLCILHLFVLFLTGCGANDKSRIRWVTYSGTGVPLDAKEVIAAANAVSEEKLGLTVDLEINRICHGDLPVRDHGD